MPLLESEYPGSRGNAAAAWLSHRARRADAARGRAGRRRSASSAARPAPSCPAEVRLVETFADQAAIAIENVRLVNETKEALREVEERTAELSEALDYQTAISDVLRVISQSPSDVAPVFEAILESASRLFGNPIAAVFRYDGHEVDLAATRNWPADAIADARRFYPGPPRPEMMSGRVVLSGQVQIQEDALSDPAYDRRTAAAGHWRRMIGAPLLKDGTADRRHRRRLARARQDAAAPGRPAQDLRRPGGDRDRERPPVQRDHAKRSSSRPRPPRCCGVISGSVADSKPVFEKILESCQRLFASSEQGVLLDRRRRPDAPRRASRQRPRAPRKAVPGRPRCRRRREQRERRVIHIRDVLNDADVPPGLRAIAERIGVGTYSQVIAPMLWEGESIGSLYVIRQPAIGFSDKEIGLLRTFADQAVIAIQNARLFNETKEALEQQTATAEVLQVISSSVADTRPVFDKILDSCERLFAATGLGIYLVDEAGVLHSGGFRAAPIVPANLVRFAAGEFPRRVEGTATEIAIRERRVVHFPDVLTDVDVPAPLRRVAAASGSFSIAFAPMLWEGRGVGVDPGVAHSAAALHRQGADAAQDLRRPGGDRDPERAPVQGDPGQEPRARAGQQAQVGVPRQHVARAAHAAQRDHRLLRGALGEDVRRGQREAARVPARHPLLGPPPAHADQRHPRPVEDRGRPDGARPGDDQPADAARQLHDAGPRARQPAGPDARARGRGRPRRLGRRYPQAQAGRDQPALERGQVHAGRRQGDAARAPARATRSRSPSSTPASASPPTSRRWCSRNSARPAATT